VYWYATWLKILESHETKLEALSLNIVECHKEAISTGKKVKMIKEVLGEAALSGCTKNQKSKQDKDKVVADDGDSQH
jgi:hypothetical protein